MKLPDGHDVSPRDFRELLANSQEARMLARSVLKSDGFPGVGFRRETRDGKAVIVVGPDTPTPKEQYEAARESLRTTPRRPGLLGRIFAGWHINTH